MNRSAVIRRGTPSIVPSSNTRAGRRIRRTTSRPTPPTSDRACRRIAPR
jgi:hypothetical protein